jgi:hypothetical protein
MPRHLDINYTPQGKPVTVDLDISVAKGGKITDLFNELVAHHRRKGHEPADARDLAFLELATLYHTAHGKFRDHFVDAKSSLMDRLLDVEEQTLRFYDDILGGNKTPDVNQLRSLLGRMGQLFDELRRPAKKMVDDIEAQRAARAAQTFEAIPATKPLDTPAQQRAIMTPDEKFELLKEKGWSISPDGGTATRTKDGVTFKATIDRSHPQQLVTVEITKAGKTEVIVEGEVRPYNKAPDPTGNILQFHHQVQDAACLALAQKHGLTSYTSGGAPTIALRDHKGGSPHNRITGVQNNRDHTAFGSFGEIRDAGIADLKHSGRPADEIVGAVKAWDDWFNTTVWPEIQAKFTPDKAAAIKGKFTEIY